MKKKNEVRMKENGANSMMKMLINDQVQSKNDIMHIMNNKKLNLNFRIIRSEMHDVAQNRCA